jgi:uncharacterized membrane protein
MISRMRPADWLAGIGGLVLLVSLWLPWYGADAAALSQTAWQAFSELDVLLALLALPAIGVPVSAALSKGPATPVAFALIASCASALAVLLVLFRLIDQPGSNELVTVEYGAWIGLAGAVLAFAGSWLALADEHTKGVAPPQVPVRPAPLDS